MEQGNWKVENGNRRRSHGANGLGLTEDRRSENGKKWRKRENIFNYLIFNVLNLLS